MDRPHGRPASLLVDLVTASASIPVVGRWLRPLVTATALGVRGYHHLPEVALASARALSPWALLTGSTAVRGADAVYERALREGLSPGPVDPADQWRAPGARRVPWSPTALRRQIAVRVGVRYGPDPAHRLDVWRRHDLPADAAAPVLLHVPGGDRVSGGRRRQAHAMLGHLARSGWVCLAADYRIDSRDPWPAPVHDVKRAIVWTKRTVEEYGGNPDFVALSGGSAGGHLAALAGLTENDPRLQPAFPTADTTVAAVVALSGRYDRADRADDPDTVRDASPLARVHPGAPPFLVIHGAADTTVPVAQARALVAALREVSCSPVAYAELPGARHGFDLVEDARAADTARAVERFLAAVRATGPTTTGTGAAYPA